MNFGHELYAINAAYAKQLGLQIWRTNVQVEKIDSLYPKTFEIVLTSF